MTAELLTDRVLIARLLGASDQLVEEELVAFASMKERMEADPGASLTGKQRMWAEEVFSRNKLNSPTARAKRKKMKKDPGKVPFYWWEREENKPLKPPTGTVKPWLPR